MILTCFGPPYEWHLLFRKWCSKNGIGEIRPPGFDEGVPTPFTGKEPVPCDPLIMDGFSGRSSFSGSNSFKTGDSPSRMSSRRSAFPRSWRKSSSAGTTWIFTPLVTLWVFLGQVLSADPSCRAAVARLIAHRVSQGLKAVQLGDRCLLPGEETPARALLLRRGLPGGAKPGRAGRFPVALERPPRLSVRRLDGLHARHRGEPKGIPSDLQSEAGDGVPRRADWGHHFALVRSDPQPGDLPLRRERPKRSWGCCASCGACFAAATSWWRIA